MYVLANTQEWGQRTGLKTRYLDERVSYKLPNVRAGSAFVGLKPRRRQTLCTSRRAYT
jgi:cobalamin biosynthesis Mg chelatase CobN